MKSLSTFIAIVCIVATCGTSVAGVKVVLVAGGGNRGDGSRAVEAALDSPFGVDFDRAGSLFLVELTGERVRRIDADGMLTTIAGDGVKGSRGDGGPAVDARFNGMHNLAIG